MENELKIELDMPVSEEILAYLNELAAEFPEDVFLAVPVAGLNGIDGEKIKASIAIVEKLKEPIKKLMRLFFPSVVIKSDEIIIPYAVLKDNEAMKSVEIVLHDFGYILKLNKAV